MNVALLIVTLFSIGDTKSISTDDLDRYAEQVVRARKACGPTAVWYCLRRFGQKPKLADVWNQAKLGESGTTLQNLLELLHSYDLPAQALVGDPCRLDELPIPAILIVDETHCIVFDGFEEERQKVRYFEPAKGEVRTVSRQLIEGHWSGQAILFERPKLSRQAFLLIVLTAALSILCLVSGAGRLKRRGT